MSIPKVLLIDNYDSFTWNLVQAFRAAGADVVVIRNDAMSVDDAWLHQPSHVVISPGPGRPEQAGISMPVITRALGRLPLLGVCLGHQALAQVLGARIVHAPALLHGKPSACHHDGSGPFIGLPSPTTVGRYHSLCIDLGSVPDELEVIATTEDGTVMGIRHRQAPAWGVQFHPESILSPDGPEMLRWFLAQHGPRTGGESQGGHLEG